MTQKGRHDGRHASTGEDNNETHIDSPHRCPLVAPRFSSRSVRSNFLQFFRILI